jgi:UDP-4-amino-4,6-dideoxy-N-acetyl-beta-L-altrosamine transaminase
MKEIPYGRQSISSDDVAAVTRALNAPFLTQGPTVREFEDALAEKTGAKFAVAYSSGTAALHGAYAAAGLRPGRGIVTSPITFAATANASLYLGGSVNFADVDPDTIMLDPAEAERRADSRTAALVPVHFGGQVADVERLKELADRKGWIVIEDAAHALGASYITSDGSEHLVGACSHSALCCFSFHPVKHITTGEGGAVTTNDPELRDRLIRFRTHGITRDPAQLRRNEGDWYYEQLELGYNYRLPDLQCALGISQLARLDGFVARRREVAAKYDAAFADDPLIRPLGVPAWSRGSYHLYVIRVDARHRRSVFDALRKSGIGANVHYIPVYFHPYYREHGFAETTFPFAEAYYAEAITLPMFPALSDADVDTVIGTLRLAARAAA